MIKHSKLRNSEYDDENTVRIINTRQAGKYISKGVLPVDVDYVFAPREGLIFIFDKDESYEVYNKWCNYEL